MERAIVMVTLVVAVVIGMASGATWGSVTIDNTAKVVTFENGQVKATYRPWGSENVIKELYAKGNTYNISGNCIDACANRKAMSEAKILEEKADRIKAEIKWGSHTTSHITLYKDCPVIKIDQISGNSPNIVDASNGMGKYAIYGSENWPRDPYKYRYPKCYYHTGDGYCADQNGESSSNDDPAPLLYNGWFINGIYRSDTDGIGYGRVVSKKVKILKLLSWGGAGLEYFWNNQLSYLYVVKNGAEEILSVGTKIADWANAGEVGLPLGGASAAEHAIGSAAARPVRAVAPSAGAPRIAVDCAGAYRIEVFSTGGQSLVRAAGVGPAEHALSVLSGARIAAVRLETAQGVRTMRLPLAK